MGFIDIHSHILPGLDDGASSYDDFLSMAGKAVECGTSIMVATPHYDPENPAYDPSEAAESVKEHNTMLEAKNIPLTLIPGMEIRISAGLSDLTDKPEELNALTLNSKGKFMLVDLPLIDMPFATRKIFFQIQLRGITPILAHPERNRFLVEHPSAVKEFTEQGVELQVDSGSLTGIFGKVARQNARSLVKEGLAKLVASDAHDVEGRAPDLSGMVSILEGLLGKNAPELILKTNPGRLLEGHLPLETVDPYTLIKKGSRNRIFRKLKK